MKKIGMLIMVGMLAVFTVACGNKGMTNEVKSDGVDKENQVAKSLEGSITISGSTSVEKVMVGLAEEFMALNPDVDITYEAIGSSAGIKNADQGVTMLGTASRNLKEKEVAWGLESKAIAYDGIAVITHPSNGVSDLTKEQVSAIYKGEITNWSEVGGFNEEIVVVSREDGSGTRGAFEEIVDFEDALTASAILAEGNGNVQTTVAGNPNAIGYVSFTYINDTVKGVKIAGVEPTTENVLAQSYSISRPFLMVYHKDNVDHVTQLFTDFIFSADGQTVVEDKGGIPVAN